MQPRLLALLLIAFPISAYCQLAKYYLGAGTQAFDDDNLKNDQVFVTYTPKGDSLIVSPRADNLVYGSVYRKIPNVAFMTRVKEYGASSSNYAWVNERSVMIVQKDGNFLLFLKDANAAREMKKAPARPEVLAYRDSVKAIIEKTNKALREVQAANIKHILTEYAKNVRSVRTDATLQKDIVKWLRVPDATAYILDNSYFITRNVYGQVLNKNITGLVKFRKNGKCFIEWWAFGYESVGDGKFSADLSTYNKSRYIIHATGAGGWVNLQEGVPYEIECP